MSESRPIPPTAVAQQPKPETTMRVPSLSPDTPQSSPVDPNEAAKLRKYLDTTVRQNELRQLRKRLLDLERNEAEFHPEELEKMRSDVDRLERENTTNESGLRREVNVEDVKLGVILLYGWDFAPKPFTRSISRLDLWENAVLIDIEGGSTIYEMRNAGLRTAKEQGCDDVLFIDADMWFPRNAARQIVSHGLPIVGGWCRARKKPFDSVIFQKVDDSSDDLRRIEPGPNVRGLYPCDATGAAFLYIRGDVLDAIESPHFINREIEAHEMVDHDEFLSEDLNFCRKARAAGFPIYIDLELRIGHCVIGIIHTSRAGHAVVLLPGSGGSIETPNESEG